MRRCTRGETAVGTPALPAEGGQVTPLYLVVCKRSLLWLHDAQTGTSRRRRA